MRTLLSVGLLLVGLVWIGQGVGLVGGSFMSGQLVWAAIGIALVVAAALLWLAGRRRLSSGD